MNKINESDNQNALINMNENAITNVKNITENILRDTLMNLTLNCYYGNEMQYIIYMGVRI